MELMVVVGITGILATLGFVSLGKHSRAAKRIEPLSMVQSIRAAQERWRATRMMYLNVSGLSNWYPRDPENSSFNGTVTNFYLTPDDPHLDNVGWLALRPATVGDVQFGYLTKAGPAGTAVAVPSSPGFSSAGWPAATENWYTIEAYGDLGWDGTFSSYLASSFDGEVLRFQDGE